MPKVVTIPVRFGESVSDTNRRSAAVVTIQRVLRGFVTRRSFGIVRRADREVDGIEAMVERDLDWILTEEKERIRTNEMLMAVLLRLDSVRGAREYRRKVIRRVISLQEFVDSMMSGANQETLETEEDQETLEFSEEIEEALKEETLKMVDCQEIPYFTIEEATEEENRETLEGAVEETLKIEEILETTAVPEAKRNKGIEIKEMEWSIVESPKEERNLEELGLRSAVERMAAENETLKGLIAELIERSALQCSMMEGLAERVQQLERTMQTKESSKY